MKKKRKLLAILAAFVFVVGVLPPITADAITFTFSVQEGTDHELTLANDGRDLQIDGQFVTPKQGTNGEIGYAVTVPDGDHATVTVSDGDPITLNFNSQDAFSLYANGSAVNAGTEFHADTSIQVQDYSDNGSGGSDPSGPQPGGIEDITVNVTFHDTMGEVIIGNAHSQEGESFNGVLAQAGTTDPAQTNSIMIGTSFGSFPASKIVIDGVEYTFSDGEDFHTLEVTGRESYTIDVYGNTSAAVKRTIIWANVDANQNADEFEPDMLLAHGSGKITAVYDAEGNKTVIYDAENNIIEGEVNVNEDGMGWASVPPGYLVQFEFVPEYGYQLTQVLANGVPLDPQDTINQYTFTMPDANIHFSAVFTKTADVVKANSSNVDSGSIALGGALEGGSAQLTVNDVQLSSDKIAGFESAAGDYTISNYLDIDLYNVYYKGKADADDVWSNKISELAQEATITITLAQGVTADDIVIVHNVHDGETFEVIAIDSYNAATNTITFKAKSFSNYAIAVKTSTTEDTKTEDTRTEDTQPEIQNTTQTAANALSAGLTNSASELASSVLTAEEQAALAAGANVDVWIEVKDIASTVSAEEKSKIQAAAKAVSSSCTVGAYLDIDLFKKVGGSISAVTSTNGRMKVTFTLPESLQADNRIYKIVRIHNGAATVLDAFYDTTAKTLTFETDQFSTYAIVYAAAVQSPSTDERVPIAATVIFIMGICGLAIVGYRRKRI